ncbi:pentatricopeptide repeat-containing protein At5g56310-like [Amborella trichopoda]|uniref:pentatricopeptide repeat-containing protein At5g56310-like n=1 Tax=Amborella trichopoda TaxID=13333 RepID=UPI0005D3B457|nr:pentatricopeptide repeat-containing protein At5g56310-like [Amborella trichopoda]|eukprot:XP_011620815.1 pentatricopeptide repeat-containing protein At5g56310-like [Amborella trichopoda]
MVEKDVISWNTLLVGYVDNGDLGSPLKAFGEMTVFLERHTWGLCTWWFHCEVLETFREMLRLNAKPNNATLVIMLSASARLGALEMVRVYRESGLCVCGDKRERQREVTWNVMIGGLAMHGHGLQALAIFRRMREERARLDGITFVGVLCACTHAGLVDEGSRNFHSMTHDCHNTPTIEHYGCMVDLLGRAGRIEEALELIKRMPIEEDSVVWSSLHGACRTFGRRKEAARMKVVMIERGIQKIPGWSSIEVNGSVAKFYSSDKRNPRSIEIFEVLSGLTQSLKSIGYDSKIDILHDVREDS